MGLRRKITMLRLNRWTAFLVAASFLMPLTFLLMVAEQQYDLTSNYKRMFYQEDISENDNFDRKMLTREKFLEIGARMKRRKDHLRSNCFSHGLDSPSQKANAWEYMVNRQYHVIWCNVFKAASTSWMYNFNLMANYSAFYLNRTKHVPLQLARRKYERPSLAFLREAQADSVSFIIVRHPLERLASAYNDKIVHPWANSFHDKLGKKIIKKYRTDPQFQWTVLYPLFEEFVMYLVDEWKAEQSLDNHWTPYTGFCTPCQFNFDVIMKVETLDEDQRYLIELAHLEDILKLEWRNKGKTNTLQEINQLYSRINKSQLDSLYQLYKYDFQLFNYTIENYYKIVKADETSSER